MLSPTATDGRDMQTKIGYIVSSSYSGSTLLALILNAHPDVGTISEFTMMGNIENDPDFKCSCGSRIRECPFFTALRDEVVSHDIPFEIDNMDMVLEFHSDWRFNALLTEKIPRFHSTTLEQVRDFAITNLPPFRGRIAEMYDRNDVFIKSILKLQNASVFIDANKSPYRMLFLNKRFDVKPLFLYKNGIAGVNSFLKVARRRKTGMTVEAATRRWFHEQVTISRCLKRMNTDDYMQIAYTDMCADTEGTINAICNFLGIGSANLSDFAGAPHHVIGNAMRLSDFSQIEERTDWKEKLTEAEVDTYKREAEKHMPRLRSLNPEVADHVWL